MEALNKFLEHGPLGICVVVLALVVVRLFQQLQALQERYNAKSEQFAAKMAEVTAELLRRRRKDTIEDE